MDDSTGATQRLVLLRVTAMVAVVTAVIHFAVAGAHYSEYWAFGVFMLGSAWLQLTWAVGLLVRPSRALIAAGAVLNAGIVAVYVVTRTAGDVIGPTPHDVEPVGFGDAFCTVCEALLVVAAVLLLVRPWRRRVSRVWAVGAPTATAALGAVLLSVSLVAGGSEMVMSMNEDAATPAQPAALSSPSGMSGMSGMASGVTGSLSLPTDSPAGPVTLPDPDMKMDTGMSMATGPCTAMPTAAQQAAAVSLVNTTWVADHKYQSLAVAKAAGYVPLTPSGQKVVHYYSPANYAATAAGRRTIDPSAPQSLVYANTPNGAVLVAVMYLDAPGQNSTPQPGGCLTQWHVHTNLCIGGGATLVVGVTHPGCPAGSVNQVTPPMMHVWFAPIPGGPTAVDAPDAQVIRAAEQVHGPSNGTA
jgi:hypothetical protein